MDDEDTSLRATPWTILLADDDPVALLALTSTLQRAFPHAHILAMKSGPAALRTLAERDVDLLVCDFKTPGMDGATVLGHAARSSPHTMRMLLAGDVDWSAAARGVNEGRIHAYQRKPIDAAALIDAAAKLLAEGSAARLRHRAFAHGLDALRSRDAGAPFTRKLGEAPFTAKLGEE